MQTGSCIHSICNLSKIGATLKGKKPLMQREANVFMLLSLEVYPFFLNVLKFHTLKCLIKCNIQTVQTQIRLLLQE